jgi:transketolase
MTATNALTTARYADLIRLRTVRMVAPHGFGYLGQALSSAELFAAHNRLGSLTVLLDANDSQVDGPVSSITTLEPIAAKWESFGWAAFDVDGHDTAAIDEALSAAAADPRPAVVIGRTSTKHGLSVLPEGADGHFIKLPAPLAEAAVKELEARLA